LFSLGGHLQVDCGTNRAELAILARNAGALAQTIGSISRQLTATDIVNDNDVLPVQLAFAWTAAREVPVIFGQLNFFMEFDVCFFRNELAFELAQHQS